MADRKYIRKRLIEIFDDYGMDKDEAVIDIEMFFVKKNGERQHKGLYWRAEVEHEDEPRKAVCVADLDNCDALDLLLDGIPSPFCDEARELILSQYEKKAR